MKFYEQVWDLISKIPRGNVTTYKKIAEKLGTTAYRAVGNACKNNKKWPLIPCHRVVKSDGSIGGFSKGVELKMVLLEKEGIKIENGKIKNFEKIIFNF